MLQFGSVLWAHPSGVLSLYKCHLALLLILCMGLGLDPLLLLIWWEPSFWTWRSVAQTAFPRGGSWLRQPRGSDSLPTWGSVAQTAFPALQSSLFCFSCTAKATVTPANGWLHFPLLLQAVSFLFLYYYSLTTVSLLLLSCSISTPCPGSFKSSKELEAFIP